MYNKQKKFFKFLDIVLLLIFIHQQYIKETLEQKDTKMNLYTDKKRQIEFTDKSDDYFFVFFVSD